MTGGRHAPPLAAEFTTDSSRDTDRVKRLPLWQAGAWVLLAAVTAQLVAGFASAIARTWLAGHGASGPAIAGSSAVLVFAMLASSLSLIAVACFAAALSGLPLREVLGLRTAPAACYAAAAIGTVMLGPAADVMMRAMQAVLPGASLGIVPMLHDLVRRIPLAVAWPVFALLPGVAEELLFRGLLQNAAPPGARAIALSGIAFALFHVDPHHVAGVLPLGLFLAWVAARCGTLVTIAAHVANNTAAIAAVHSSTFDVGYGTEQPMPWPWLPAGLFCALGAAWVIARSTPRQARFDLA